MRKFVVASVLTLGLGMWGCSGGDYSSGSVDNPAAPTPATSNEPLASKTLIEGGEGSGTSSSMPASG